MTKRRKDNRGGHNKLHAEPPKQSDPVKVRDWPWVYRAGSDKWTRKKIHAYLSKMMFEQGLISTQWARDHVFILSYEHWLMSQALAAIEANPESPMFGDEKAYSLMNSCIMRIDKCMASLGIWPLPKVALEDDATKKPKDESESGVDIDDLDQFAS